MYCHFHTLRNGLRLIHLPSDSPVAYCGFAVRAGARDELPGEAGLAHFVEHLLFKGTRKRRTWHILNRMEAVGGELNAYTSKEETFVYSVFLADDFERAVELMSDLVINSQFPGREMEKERTVVLDEIRSYMDNPSELIADEFEDMIFAGHPLGHSILGDRKSLLSFCRESCFSFVKRYYTAPEMVFFSMGRMDFRRVVRLSEKYLSDVPVDAAVRCETQPPSAPPVQAVKKKRTHQTHVMTGGRAYGIFDGRQTTLMLLNDIVGGPGMNSRLNVSLRERNGLVYHVESCVSAYTDTGVFAIYFGSDPKQREKALELIEKELRGLRENKLSDARLSAAKKQATGQVGVAVDNRENLFLGMGKSFLHRNCYDAPEEVFRKINAVTATQLCDAANEIFAPERMFLLIYE
ncbi:MAG: insulinase family protein [Tannerella sp.]|jgi:predicted Zn-dependent peptidase|nr:insulinase family protein [Tannerella sp.]